MTFFNRTYHAFIKSHMSRMCVWPGQSKYVRIIMPLVIFFGIVTFIIPQLIRLHDVWGDGESVVALMPTLLTAIIILTVILNYTLQTENIKVMLEEMKCQWKMIKNTSAVIVLDRYAERGCYFTKLYAIYINIALAVYFIVLISPVILDCVNPLNETRPKFYFYEAEYGVDPDEYYWYILAHGYIMAILGINIIVTTETIYILLVEHACALFEVVGFNLKLVTVEYTENKKNTATIRHDNNYQQICDCIVIHKEAVRFANRLENFYSVPWLVVMIIIVILISVTGVQMLINIENLSMVLRTANFTIGQIFNLFLNSIPAQQLIDSSLKIHSHVCNLNWYDMSPKVQKLLVPILIRSNKPSLLTAGKLYILSIQSFGSVRYWSRFDGNPRCIATIVSTIDIVVLIVLTIMTLRTAGSYFMILAQLL